MFPFKKPPSRAEVAKQTVIDAADAFSHHALDLLGNATDFIEGALENAHDKLEIIGEKVEHAVEKSPLEKAKLAAGAAAVAATAGEAAEKAGALKAGAVAATATAGKSVADKVGETISNVRTLDDSMPDVKRARKQARNQINDMNKEAAKYKRELEKELAREQKLFDAEQERLQREYAELQSDLYQARREAEEERKTWDKKRAQYDEKNDILRVPIAPNDRVVEFDDDEDYNDGDFRYDNDEKRGGGNAWLIFGGLLLASAGAVYYLFSSTDGKRKRAQIQDRVGQVAEGVREKVTHESDETGEPSVERVTEAASDLSDFSNEKIAGDDDLISGTIEAKLPPTSHSAGSAVDKIEEVSDKVADGIAGAGAFLADKLEAAGAGAKSAAHSAAGKLDDVKDKAAAKLDEVKKSTPNATKTPNAVVVEIISDEPVTKETTEEVLAEVEATVRNIENSAREERK